MTVSWTPFPETMHRVPETDSVVLRNFPEIPEWMLDSPAPEHGTQRRRLQEARSAWTALSAGIVPRPEHLINAPSLVIQDVVEELGAMFFEGRVFDHPLIAQGHLCRTSLVIAFQGDRIGWARTMSRWYRLQHVTLKH